MKAPIISVGIMAAAAFAQGIENLSKCGQWCINSMRSQASNLGCANEDWSCLCMNPDFTFGIRDCANEYCEQQSDAVAAQAFGTSMCQAHGVMVTTLAAGSAPPTNTAATSPKASTGDDGHMGPGLVGPLTSTFTTLVSSGNTVVTSVIVSVFTTATVVTPTTVTSTTTHPNAGGHSTDKPKETSSTHGSEGEDGNQSVDNSAEASDPAIRATAAPMGVLAAAGMAVLLL